MPNLVDQIIDTAPIKRSKSAQRRAHYALLRRIGAADSIPPTKREQRAAADRAAYLARVEARPTRIYQPSPVRPRAVPDPAKQASGVTQTLVSFDPRTVPPPTTFELTRFTAGNPRSKYHTSHGDIEIPPDPTTRKDIRRRKDGQHFVPSPESHRFWCEVCRTRHQQPTV